MIVSSFALNYYHNVEVTSNKTQAIESINEFLATTEVSQFYTEYIPIFTHAQESLPPDSTIVIVSDGKPFTKKYRGKKKAMVESCNARLSLKRTNPDIKVLCFQSTKESKATPFFKCACDAIWLQSDYTMSDKEYVADQMKDIVCDKFEKQPNPCRCIDNKNDCKSVMKTNMGNDRKTVFDVVSSHCYWKDNECHVRPNYSTIYY